MNHFFVGIALLGIIQGFACTDFLLLDAKKGCVVGRSMEFGLDLESTIVIAPKGESYQSMIDGKPGMEWDQTYSFIGLTGLKGDSLIVDGVNDQGLSFGALWLPDTKYPVVNLSLDLTRTIALQDIGAFILGTIATVDEAKEAFLHTVIYPESLPQLGGIPPIHFSLHDRSGNSLVIEFLDNKIKIIENPIGVLTNNPSFEWHITNLRNYLNLSVTNVAPKTFTTTSTISKESATPTNPQTTGITLSPTGQGSGMVGLPGDLTPPSRFTKIAILKQFVTEATSSKENVTLAFHLLNSVDIPKGIIQARRGEDADYTQWTVVKDLQNVTLYFRTYDDLNIKSITLNDALSNGPQTLSMSNLNAL